MDFTNFVHYNDGQYPCRIIQDYDQSYAHEHAIALLVYLDAPGGTFLTPVQIGNDFNKEADIRPYIYDAAMRVYNKTIPA